MRDVHLSDERHLSDDRIVELCLDAQAGQEDRAHLMACLSCESRRALLAGTLREISTVVVAEADAAFPPERLERQRARIAQRIAQDGRPARPARVISFPAGPAAEPSAPRTRPHMRWAGVAAAVVASFVGGQLAEHFRHDLPGRRQAAQPAAAGQAAPAPIRTVPSDDEVFLQIELAVAGGPAVLQTLDILTPRAWDVR